ncbi:MAG: hypothetical protein KA436_01495 [Oligoflexales bacterium]|nr:hypothetical protein [Oligoflexales bacterium]
MILRPILLAIFSLFGISSISQAQSPTPQSSDIPTILRNLVQAIRGVEDQLQALSEEANTTLHEDVPLVLRVWSNSNQIVNEKLSLTNLMISGAVFGLGSVAIYLPTAILYRMLIKYCIKPKRTPESQGYQTIWAT